MIMITKKIGNKKMYPCFDLKVKLNTHIEVDKQKKRIMPLIVVNNKAIPWLCY